MNASAQLWKRAAKDFWKGMCFGARVSRAWYAVISECYGQDVAKQAMLEVAKRTGALVLRDGRVEEP